MRELLTLLREIRDRLAGPAEGLDAAGVATLLGISKSKVHSLNADGMLPSPAAIGAGCCPRWSRGEVIAWLRAGAPTRNRWQMMRDAELRKLAG